MRTVIYNNVKELNFNYKGYKIDFIKDSYGFKAKIVDHTEYIFMGLLLEKVEQQVMQFIDAFLE